MKLQRLREALPLLFTFGAVLLIGVLFFSFSYVVDTNDDSSSAAESPTQEIVLYNQ